jgi:regulator of sigma E protease
LQTGDRVLGIDGTAVADASVERDLIRASGRGGVPMPMKWRVERAGRVLEFTVTPSIVDGATQQIGRVGVQPGLAPAMVTVRYGVVEGLTKAVSQTWQMSALTVKMLGKMLIGQASLKNLSGPLTIADYAGHRLPRIVGDGQREPRSAQPAAAAGARWRTPDVLSFRGCDGAAGLRGVA